MIALCRKELEALAPWWLAGALLVVSSGLSILWGPPFVTEDLGAQLADGNAQSGILWMLGFLIGQGTVAYEERDGHTEFLDGLPTTRAALYTAKVSACVAYLCCVVGSSLASDLLIHALAAPAGALSPVVPVLLLHALMAVAGLCGLGVGMLLSWLGPLAYGALALALVVAGCAGVVAPPVLAWLPLVGSVGTLGWDLGRVSHPVGPVALEGAIGLLAMVASGALFLGPGRALVARGSQVVGALRYGLVGCVTLILAPIAAFALVMLLVEHGGPLLRGRRALTTEHFRVLYLPGDEAHAGELADRLDALSEEVAALVGSEAPLQLDVELLGAPSNHAGVFTGGKIRLAADAEIGVLAHELAHAHAFHLAGKASYTHRDHTHFFDEGLADWVGARLTGGEPVPTWAGALVATNQVRFDELVDGPTHQARHDIRQSYVLGQVFVVALVDVAGTAAPTCVLTELGRVEGDAPIPGLALWYGLADRCGIDLDAVQDRWTALLDEARGRIPSQLPSLRSKLRDDGRLEVRDEAGLGWPLHCGFRDTAASAAEHWVFVAAGADGTCEPQSAHEWCGEAVAVLRDQDSDGHDELVVACAGDNFGQDRPGRVEIYSGATLAGALDARSATLVLHTGNDAGEKSYDRFGDTLLTGVDLTGDGLDDLVIGSPTEVRGGGEGGCICSTVRCSAHDPPRTPHGGQTVRRVMQRSRSITVVPAPAPG